jgi:twitching motility protein PilI
MSQSTPVPVPAPAFRKPDANARRLRLREFQAQLVERMQAARTGDDTQLRQLGVEIGSQCWLLNLKEAGEIITVGEITHVPLTQPWFLGLTNLRGNLISVVDLAHLMGQAPTPIDKESRIVAFGPALSFNSALLVKRVMGLRNVTTMTLQENVEGVASWIGSQYRDSEGVLWSELKLSAMTEDAQFLQVSS